VASLVNPLLPDVIAQATDVLSEVGLLTVVFTSCCSANDEKVDWFRLNHEYKAILFNPFYR
jgi:hypothetical protein